MRYEYCIAYDDGNILIRNSDDGNIERYDVAEKRWIQDFEMSKIFFGKMPVRALTECEALNLIGDGPGVR